jgi:tetratricopeptide (TPR) repeat protein
MKVFFKIFVLFFCFQASAQVEKSFDEGLGKFMQRDFKNASIAFKEVIKINPQNHEAHYYIGVCNIRLNFYKEAITNFDKAIELNPKYSKAYYNRGVARFYLSDNFSGCIDFKKAVEIDPTYDEALKSIKEFCN